IGRLILRSTKSWIITRRDYCRVVVTGIGIVCPLGVGRDRVWKNLIDGKCGISPVVGDGYESIPCKVAAYVPNDELDLNKRFTANELRTLSKSTLYALVAAEEALSDANWKPNDDKDKQRTGVAVGMGMIDMNEVIHNGTALQTQGFNRVSPHFVTKLLVNMPAGHISIKYGLKGPNHSVSTACTTGVHSIGDAFSFIQRGAADVMICGGTESVISPLSIAAFSRIRALSTKFNDKPTEASRPFDSQRCGFVMGEGCGLVVLEELNHAISRKAKIYAEILGYGLSGDANHMTAPGKDGMGAMECMQASIDDSHIHLEDITHINSHATSTPIGDEIELKAIKQLFGDHSNNIMITSTKGSTGHLLGAAGSVEAIFTILSCNHSLVPPTINLSESIDNDLDIVANVTKKWLKNRRIAITNSFGFGGTNASLVISNFIL
ncbi:3-oxoacyl-[acyl-carrier-protein] synthase, mitochondrial-like, partial [Oppia nitens]|uniref:3-oxoacyl-[acyl-carrier-protein] synthase, mitochondrial-like n=1 Tax=Oppia nitens TaxID=1686743 RepID=UPI0023DA4B2E